MIQILFVIAGIAAAINVYTYGKWLKAKGNTAGSLLAYALAITTVALPVFNLFRKTWY